MRLVRTHNLLHEFVPDNIAIVEADELDAFDAAHDLHRREREAVGLRIARRGEGVEAAVAQREQRDRRHSHA